MKRRSWFRETVENRVGQIVRIEDVLLSERTPFQQIEVLQTGQFGRVLVLDGAINVGEKDEFIYHEMLTHVPLLVHPHAEKLLVIGGGDGGVVREVLKHPVAWVDLVEIDSRVMEISRQYLPDVSCGLEDPRVHIHVDDGAHFLEKAESVYDVIIVDSTDPMGVGAVLYGEPFYRHVYRALRDGGTVTTQTESPFFDQDIIRDLYPKLRSVFARVRPYFAPVPFYPGVYWSFAFCSMGLDPIEDFTPSSISTHPLETRYYDEQVHRAAFVIPKCFRELLDNERVSPSCRGTAPG